MRLILLLICLVLSGCITVRETRVVLDGRVCQPVKVNGYSVWCYECYQTVEQGETPTVQCGGSRWHR